MERASGVAGDVALSGASGVAKGFVGLPGVPGNIMDLIHQVGTPAVAALLERTHGPEVANRFRELSAATESRPSLPTSSDFTSAAGLDYQPQTTAGRYAETIGGFAPAMLGGPVSASRLLARAGAPGVASQAGGEATAGTPAEPWARIAGAVVGGRAGQSALGATGRGIENVARSGPVQHVAQQVGRAAPRNIQNVLLHIMGFHGSGGATLPYTAATVAANLLGRLGTKPAGPARVSRPGLARETLQDAILGDQARRNAARELDDWVVPAQRRAGIDLSPVHLPGTRPADYLRELARNPDILARNIDQASNFNFGGMSMPTKIAGNPAMMARFNDLVARGYGRQAIADELNVGKATVGRELNRTNVTTAAAENPSFWDAPENIKGLKAGLARGDSFEKIAEKIGTSPGNVSSKAYRLRDAGEWPNYTSREPSFWENPAKQAEFKRDVNDGLSVRQLARKYDTATANISRWIHEIQARHGELLDWAPQTPLGGKTPQSSGRTPSLPQSRFMQGEGAPSDPEMERSLIQYLRSKGLHAAADSLVQVG